MAALVSEDGTRLLCSEPGCENSKPRHAWAYKTKDGEGWFDQRNGDSWCPQHVPDWVDQWRRDR